MKNPDRTTFAVTNGTFPRRAEAVREPTADPAESSSGLYAESSSHRFPTVPKLRRRLIPPVPAPYAYRESASQAPREDASLDTLQRVGPAKTHGVERRTRSLVVMAVGMVVGLCTALFRLATSRFS